MQFQQALSKKQFHRWLIEDKENRLLLIYSSVVLIISFAWLKILYPFPNFMPPDSYSYLDAAYNNDFINMWPIGYSKFLRLISSFTNSHLVLVIIQYLILEFSILFMLFTVRYLVSPNITLFRILLSICILNPLIPHVANFISSDGLFTAISIVWFTQLLWLIYNPNKMLVLIHVFVLALAFITRYNALYYPIISIVVILTRKVPSIVKYISISLIIIVISSFILTTSYEYYKNTGMYQYSAFGGWQLAANALYGYAYADSLEDANMVPKKFRALHNVVNENIKIYRKFPRFIRPDGEIGVFYLWNAQSPLKLYMVRRQQGDSTIDSFRKWASMGPVFADYGRYLISKYPKSYLVHYLWPNFQRYYAPPAQFMEHYNLGIPVVDSIAMKWFGWTNNKVPAIGVKKIWIASMFTVLTSVINMLFIASFLSFWILFGFKQCAQFNKEIIFLSLLIWISNMVFSVLSAPIELRYQLFPLIINSVWAVLFVGYNIKFIYKADYSTELSASVSKQATV